MSMNNKRHPNNINRYGSHKAAYLKARSRILKTESVCSICGQPIDKSRRYPDPLSASVDHVIPIAKGGAKSDPSNLAIAHLICNKIKSDKISRNVSEDDVSTIRTSRNWFNFSCDENAGGV